MDFWQYFKIIAALFYKVTPPQNPVNLVQQIVQPILTQHASFNIGQTNRNALPC
jgi:hypothetical protein